MKTPEQRATEYLEATKALPVSIKHKELVLLLKEIKRDQNEISCLACAEAMLNLSEPNSNDTVIDIDQARNACMNVKAS